MAPPAIEDKERPKLHPSELPRVQLGLKAVEGTLAAVCVPETTVTRYKEKSSTVMRKNGRLALYTAVWCQETEVVDGEERVHITTPADGWIDKKDVIVGQVCVVNAFNGAIVRESPSLDSKIVDELPYETRVFVTEKETVDDGKVRAKVVAPALGWLSVKCVLPVCDKLGNLVAAGKSVVTTADVDSNGIAYSHYVEINHDQMYKALWDTGLNYGPSFRNVRRAWRTDSEAWGLIGPYGGNLDGWLIHPALADSLLHVSCIAPNPPEGGWPWLQDENNNSATAAAA